GRLEQRLGDKVQRLKGWPKVPRALSGHLKRLAPNLREVGWDVDYDRSSKERTWYIQRHGVPEAPQPPSGESHATVGQTMHYGADRCGDGLYDGHDANDAIDHEPWNPDRL